MRVAVQQDVPGLQRRQVGRVVHMAVGRVEQAAARREDRVVGQHRKFQHHLVHLGVAVAAHAENLIFPRVQQGDDLLGRIVGR